MSYETELAQFETTRRETERLASGLTQSQMDYRPAEDRWSVGEVLDHLLKAEGLYRDDIAELVRLTRAGEPPVVRRTMRDMDVTIGPIPRRVFAWLELPLTLMAAVTPRPLADALMHSRLLPTKNPTLATPQHGRPADDLRRELGEAIARTRALFDDNADADFSQMVHKSPLTGSTDPMGMLHFLSLHEGRHQKQIGDVLGSPGFPAPEPAREETAG